MGRMDDGGTGIDEVRIGEIVWARVSGYPWWPATISRNLQKKAWKRQGKVWVNFFNDNQGAWINQKTHLRAFNDASKEMCMVKPTHRNYQNITEAVKEAVEVLDKQKEDGVDMAVVDPEDIMALAERNSTPQKPGKEGSGKRGRPKAKRNSDAGAESEAKRQKFDSEIVPADDVDDEVSKSRARERPLRRGRTPARLSNASEPSSVSRRRKQKQQPQNDATETSEEDDAESARAKRRAKKKRSTADDAKSRQRVASLELEVGNLRSELKKFKAELKERKALPRKEVVQVASVPPGLPLVEVDVPSELNTEKCEKEGLLEHLKVLKQRAHTFEELSEIASDHKKTAGELASKFNARIRALSNAEAAARKAELEVTDSLVQLLKWNIPFELLKESQAGKPVRKVEMKSGRRSQAIARLSKTLINRWMAVVKSGNETKKTDDSAKIDEVLVDRNVDMGDVTKTSKNESDDEQKGKGSLSPIIIIEEAEITQEGDLTLDFREVIHQPLLLHTTETSAEEKTSDIVVSSDKVEESEKETAEVTATAADPFKHSVVEIDVSEGVDVEGNDFKPGEETANMFEEKEMDVEEKVQDDGLKATSEQGPANGPGEDPPGGLAEGLAEGPADGPTDGSADVPADGPADMPADVPADGPADDATNDLADGQVAANAPDKEDEAFDASTDVAAVALEAVQEQPPSSVVAAPTL